MTTPGKGFTGEQEEERGWTGGGGRRIFWIVSPFLYHDLIIYFDFFYVIKTSKGKNQNEVFQKYDKFHMSPINTVF